MTVKMIQNALGASDETGATVKTYVVGEVIDTSTTFGKNLAKSFIENKFAEEIKVVKPSETKVVETTEAKRARNTDGTLKADDKKTPEINEAWEGGKAPDKKGSTKKK